MQRSGKGERKQPNVSASGAGVRQSSLMKPFRETALLQVHRLNETYSAAQNPVG